uniref:Ribosomal protein S10 n=1 Tax=Spumella sp. Baekdong012001B8 TaxID=2782410 RepID=A0A7S6PV82_9STRA|nr:ribosomal protein S10 [Spumella sp. Baekdong012001B8]
MKFRVTLKAFDSEQIKTACRQLQYIFDKAGCATGGHVAFPTRIKKFCVIRSPHANKASREQFEIRIFKRLIDIHVASPFILSSLMGMELPYGIVASIKIIG